MIDTGAIVAFLYNEPGHGTVADLLSDAVTGDADGSLAETNASGAFRLVGRFEGIGDATMTASLREADRDRHARQVDGRIGRPAIESVGRRLAAELKADGTDDARPGSA